MGSQQDSTADKETEAMDHFQIRLYSTGGRGELEGLERSLTDVRDKLDILRTQTEVLMTYWEGPARRQWNREFAAQLRQIEDCLKGLNRLTDAVNEIAGRLAETERNNEKLADQMY